PRFAEAWPDLRGLLNRRPALLVDVANVMGSRPDGWWRDRAGAATRVLAGLDRLAAAGMPAADLALPGARWWPRTIAILEGRAKAAADAEIVEVLRAERDGDSAIAEAVAASGDPSEVTVV